MKLIEMNPYVRFARIQKTPLPRVPSYAFDHRIFVCLVGSGTLVLGDRLVPVRKGTLVYIRSGVPYAMTPGSGPITWVGCNFDFARAFGPRAAPGPALPADRFRADSILEPTLFSDCALFDAPIVLTETGLEPLFSRIVREYSEFSPFSDALCGAQLKGLLLETAKRATLQSHPVRQQAEEILSYIHGHYNDPLTNQSLAARFSYHPNYIGALVRRATGVPLHRYIQQYRVHQAEILLQSTDLTVAEVGAEVGLPELKSFSKCFARVTGRAPSQFRAEKRAF